MSGIATAVIGSALVGGAVAADGSRRAANTAKDASAISNAQYEQNREDMAPWREAGVTSLGQLSKGLAPGGEFTRQFDGVNFEGDPGYQFRLGQGLQGVERGAAARGGLLSGGTLKALTRYGQDFASNEYGNAYSRFTADQTNRFNRLASVSGLGQTSANQIAGMGTDNANRIGMNSQNAAQAIGAGNMGAAGSISNGVTSLANFYQQQQMMNRMFPAPAGGSGGGNGFGIGSSGP